MRYFNQCNESRRKYRIPDDEPVVLLTDHSNEYNWFSGSDNHGKLNLFVQTGMWDRFTFPDFRYPVVYLLAAIPLRLKMFDSFEVMAHYFHSDPRPDICANKNDCLSQVISRIRRKFEDAMPVEMAKQYVIGGESGRKRRIVIDRDLVELLNSKKTL